MSNGNPAKPADSALKPAVTATAVVLPTTTTQATTAPPTDKRTPIEIERDLANATYDAALTIGKKLSKLPRENAIKAMQHIGVEYGLKITDADAK